MRRVIETRRGVIVSIAAAMWMCPVVSWAQTYPKPVRYVVPFGPGGSPDLVARLLGERLTRLWGQQVVVENRVGAAGLLGTAFVAKSAPDGYTLVQCNVASSGIAVSLNAKMPYDQLRDLAAITRIGMLPNVLTVHPSVPIKSIKEIGFSNYEVNSWYGVCAPSATPAAVLDKLQADIAAVLRMPDFQQRMSELVMDATPMSREEFDQFIRADIARWAHIIKQAGIPLQ